MKKAIVILFSILFLFSLMASIAFADSDNSYYIKELDLTVTIPKEFTVFTRDMKTDDPNLAKYGFTKDFLLSTMKTQHTYIEALSSDGLTEMYVAMFEDSGMSDFSTQSDATLKAMMDELMPQYASMGITMTKCELYHHSQTKFIKMYGEHPVSGMTVYTRQYSTVYNGHTYNFTMQSFSGKITNSQEKALQSVVDSAVFGKQSAGGSTSEHSKTFDYKDSKTGLKFTVPAGWKEEPLSKKRETIDVKFVSEGAAFAEIMYGSIDMWSSIPEADKAGMNRSDVNNTLFSLEDISAMMGAYSGGTTTISYNDITTVTYNGSEYFCLTANTSSSGITIPMTQLMHIDNGYIYLFQYYGDRTGENYNGFESLLKSTVYSTPQASATATPKPTAKPTTKPTATAMPQPSASETNSKTSATTGDKIYYIPESDLTVTVPNGFTVFTRTLSEDDPNLAKYGYTKDSLLSDMEKDHVHLMAISDDGLSMMYISVFENINFTNFSRMSDSDLEKLMTELGNARFVSTGMTVNNSRVYHHSQTNFIKIFSTSLLGETKVWIRQYSTVYNNQTINFTLLSFRGFFSSDQDMQLTSLVDSAVFGEETKSYFDYKTAIWITIAGFALFALIPGFIAKNKGNSFWVFYFLSFVITPVVTTVIVLCLKKRNTMNDDNNIVNSDERHNNDVVSNSETSNNQSSSGSRDDHISSCLTDDCTVSTEEPAEQQTDERSISTVGKINSYKDYKCASAFIKHYNKMLAIARNSSISHNPEFELLPAMFVVSDYAAVSAEKDRVAISNALLKVINKTHPSLNKAVFDERCALYGAIIRGKELRCEWYMGDTSVFYENAILKCSALLGDILFNPDCADDYDKASVPLYDISESFEFTENVMNPLIDEFVSLFKDICDA